MHLGAAERLAVDDFLDRGQDDLRAAEMNAAIAAHHDHFVCERRDVGAAGGAAAEHGRNLRHAAGGHATLIEESGAEMVLSWEHLVLLGQERAAAIHEIEARQPVLPRDLLRADVLGDGFGEEAAPFDRRIVCDEHAWRALHNADPGHEPRRPDFVSVEPPSRHGAYFQERAQRIDQHVNPFPHHDLVSRMVTRDHRGAPALGHGAGPLSKRAQQRLVGAGVLGERSGVCVDAAEVDWHA